MPLTLRVLIGLGLGLLGGVVVSQYEGLDVVLPVIEPIGTLWVNAIRMTVVPLVVSLLITAIAGDHDTGPIAELGWKAIVLFAVMVVAACAFTAVASPALLNLRHFDPAAAEALRGAGNSVASASTGLPSFGEWLIGLVPSNPVRAAVDGAMLPLVVFVVLLAFAARGISGVARITFLRFFEAIREAMFILVGWVMAVAPLGVFALMLPLAARTSGAAAGAFGYFVLVTCGLIIVAMLFLYPLAAVVGRLSAGSFARACAPVQAVAFTTKSSFASLPAMLVAGKALGLSPKVTGLVLPTAVSIFKFASPIGRGSGAYFVAWLYSIDLGTAEILAIAGGVGLLSFYTPGIPSGGLLIMTPLFLALNLPVEGIGILIALDQIVDMFITPANVTANLAVVAVLTRSDRPGRQELQASRTPSIPEPELTRQSPDDM